MEANNSLPVAPSAWARIRHWSLAGGTYVLLMGLFRFAVHALGVTRRLHGHLLGPYFAAGLLFGALWVFGWGGGEWISGRLSARPDSARALSAATPILRALIPGTFSGAVYVLMAVPLGAVSPVQLLAYCALPTALAGVFEVLPPGERLSWQDLLVLAGLAVPIEYHWLRVPPGSDLGGVPKLLFADVGLYLYIVQRRLPGIGFDLRLRTRDLLTGLREWALFAPIGIGLGLALGFLKFHARMPAGGSLGAAVLVTFLFVAVPEEVFFRGLLQNLLQTRLPRRQALGIASALFGLSHYVHGPVFNWRYVILASIAGWFYGRAWLRERRVGASVVSHTLVDVIWQAWLLNPAAF